MQVAAAVHFLSEDTERKMTIFSYFAASADGQHPQSQCQCQWPPLCNSDGLRMLLGILFDDTNRFAVINEIEAPIAVP